MGGSIHSLVLSPTVPLCQPAQGEWLPLPHAPIIIMESSLNQGLKAVEPAEKTETSLIFKLIFSGIVTA